MRPALRSMVAVCVAALFGCGRADAIEAALARGSVTDALAGYDALPEADPERLVPIAEQVLYDAALDPDVSASDRAFVELGAAGTRARRVLERLALASDALCAARASQRLAVLGDGAARERLQALRDAESPELRALALDAQPEPESADVVDALGAAHAVLRAAGIRAARRLALPLPTPIEDLLVELLRLDPEPGVRAAAAGALTLAGARVAGAVQAALADASTSVRSAALDALWAVAPERAELQVSRLLGGDPSPDSLEAARRMLGAGRSEALTSRAREHLVRALSVNSLGLRAQAAVALGADAAQVKEALSARLAVERVRSVRLALALALGADHASAALVDLASGGDVVAAEAAETLAAHGQASGLERLRKLRASRHAPVRRVVYAALGRALGRVSEVRPGLSDADAGVRLASAGAVLTGRGRAVRSPGRS